MTIYQPSDDSYFFSDFLKDHLSKQKNKNIKYLDLGTGSGILSQTASQFLEKKNILAIDIDEESINQVKSLGFKTKKSNLFSKIPKNKKFDLITFNAPYLPEDKNYKEPKDSQTATTGGKMGDEISLKFLKQAKEHLNENGKIFLLVSSLTPMKKLEKFGPKIISRKKVFFEKLLILEFN